MIVLKLLDSEIAARIKKSKYIGMKFNIKVNAYIVPFINTLR